MSDLFKFSVIKANEQKQLDFANYSPNFVEVVFTIDNKEVKFGEIFSQSVKGYCYPPDHHKPIRTMKNGEQLPFAKRGVLKAYIYEGTGELIDDDSDVPPFIKFKLNERRLKADKDKKVSFKRTRNVPIEVLEILY